MYHRFVRTVSSLRLVPHLFFYSIHKNNKVISYDTERWLQLKRLNLGNRTGFIHLMTFYPEFRNLFYHRIGHVSKLINFLCPRMDTLYIKCRNIGPGLYIQHGFATIISAHAIGKDCWINQQVTIGFSNATDSPTLLDNVSVKAGAKVIGKVVIGNNSVVGANGVVVKSIPDNCTVAGVPAYILKRDGVKVREKL